MKRLLLAVVGTSLVADAAHPFPTKEKAERRQLGEQLPLGVEDFIDLPENAKYRKQVQERRDAEKADQKNKREPKGAKRRIQIGLIGHAAMDLNEDGNITKDEYLQAINEARGNGTYRYKDRWNQHEGPFKVYDINGDGQLNWDEYFTIRIRENYRDPSSHDEPTMEMVDMDRQERYFKAADVNGNGIIDVDEYAGWVYGTNEAVKNMTLDEWMVIYKHKKKKHQKEVKPGLTYSEIRPLLDPYVADSNRIEGGTGKNFFVLNWIKSDYVFTLLDKNEDRRIDREEIELLAPHHSMFVAGPLWIEVGWMRLRYVCDDDFDGTITQAEMSKAFLNQFKTENNPTMEFLEIVSHWLRRKAREKIEAMVAAKAARDNATANGTLDADEILEDGGADDDEDEEEEDDEDEEEEDVDPDFSEMGA